MQSIKILCVIQIHFWSGSTGSRLEGSEIGGQEVGKPVSSKSGNKAVRKRRRRREDLRE